MGGAIVTDFAIWGWYCLALGVISAIGQLFIFYAISTMGVLTLNIITTSRKMLTILISILVFNHMVNDIQGLCLVTVAIGTAFELYSQTNKKSFLS